MTTHQDFTPDQSCPVLDQQADKRVPSDSDLDLDNSELCSMIMMVCTLLSLCGLAVAFVSGSFPWFFVSFGIFLYFALGMPRKLLC